MRLPQTIGPWRLTKRLGHGAFGSVYLAELSGDAGFSSRVAVKILDAGAIETNPTVGQSLIDEAKLLSRLQHPGIVRVLDLQAISHDFLGETYAMSMEYVEGVTLAALLDQVTLSDTTLSLAAVLSLFADVTDALDYAHSHVGEDGQPSQIVHRDLKPANLVITPKGYTKILDFGIAWASERGVEATREGMTKGTLPYMSPEQVHGMSVDGRSDLYSLGTIIFEMLVGEPFVGYYPFGHTDVARMVKRVAELHYGDRRELLQSALQRHPHPLAAGPAAALESLLAKLLARDPAARFQTAGELRDALELLYVFWRPEVGRRELAATMRASSGEIAAGSGGVSIRRDGAASGGPLPLEDPNTLPFQSGSSGEPVAAPTPAGSGLLRPGPHFADEITFEEADEGFSAKETLKDSVPALGSADTLEIASTPSSGTTARSPSQPSLRPPSEPSLRPPSEPSLRPPSEPSLRPPRHAPSGPPPLPGAPGTDPKGRPSPRITERLGFRAALAGMMLIGLLLLVLAPEKDDGMRDAPKPEALVAEPEPTPNPALVPRVADVRLEGRKRDTEANVSVHFVDSRGETIFAPVLSGLESRDDLALLRDDAGWPTFALVGTRAYQSSVGLLVLWDLRAAQPREVWRLANFFEETPELHIGVHGATSYGFEGLDFLPGGGEIPHVLAVAHDRNFAPSWLLRVGAAGDIVGKRYHPGHLRDVLVLDEYRVVVSGVSNRLCAHGKPPCDQEEVVWLVPPPTADERTEFLPGCGGTPTTGTGRGYSWPAPSHRIRGVASNAASRGGFEVTLRQPKTTRRAACDARLSFDERGDYVGQYSDCGFEPNLTPISADSGLVCEDWAALAD